MVNPQPLQARPFEEQLVQVPIEVDGGDEGGSEYEDMNGSFRHEPMNNGGGGGEVEARVSGASASASRTSELTIAFEGEVYVFPTVTPEKVCYFYFFIFQALLCLVPEKMD